MIEEIESESEGENERIGERNEAKKNNNNILIVLKLDNAKSLAYLVISYLIVEFLDDFLFCMFVCFVCSFS